MRKMKFVFKGKCKNCNHGIRKNKKGVTLKGGDKKNDATDYISCLIGGIRDPNSNCNMIDALPASKNEGDNISEFGKGVRREAVEEYTEIVRKIRVLEIKGSGSTGFLLGLKEAAYMELIKFLGIKEKK